MNKLSWVEHLNLQPHPEGGYFSETYRSEGEIPAAALPELSGARHYSTAIYFLLGAEDKSAFHRIKQDEVWHFYQGSGLTVHVIGADGGYRQIKLGSNPLNGEVLQAVVEAGAWFGASLTQPQDASDFTLVGCTVAPGFDFADFELAERQSLLSEFPQHRAIIEKLTN